MFFSRRWYMFFHEGLTEEVDLLASLKKLLGSHLEDGSVQLVFIFSPSFRLSLLSSQFYNYLLINSMNIRNTLYVSVKGLFSPFY